jgi:hypothetical protein
MFWHAGDVVNGGVVVAGIVGVGEVKVAVGVAVGLGIE